MKGRTWQSEKYRYGFNGQEKDTDINEGGNHTTAEFWEYSSVIGRRWNIDPVFDPSISSYAVNEDNPILMNDPDGDCPNCVTGAIGAGIGALVGGAIEAGTQIYQHGKVNNWKAVGGAALQGGITGGVAGLTGGASLLGTVAAAGGANIVGGELNRSVQDKETTTSDVITDGILGAGFGFLGHKLGQVFKNSLDDLSSTAKGRLGETMTEVKYTAKGYKSQGKAVVETGKKTTTGKNQVAKYDHKMTNIFTGKQLTVESKFNKARLTKNQVKAKPNINTSGGLIIDRTTSEQLGRIVKIVTTGSSGQIPNN